MLDRKRWRARRRRWTRTRAGRGWEEAGDRGVKGARSGTEVRCPGEADRGEEKISNESLFKVQSTKYLKYACIS